jgi:hypothetical protein
VFSLTALVVAIAMAAFQMATPTRAGNVTLRTSDAVGDY